MKRRIFIRNSAIALSSSLLPQGLMAAKANQKLRIAHIGVGNMGLEDLKTMAAHPQVEIAALCDVDATFLAQAGNLFPNALRFKDYRDMITQHGDSFDAVVVSTPDHTHAPASLLAMEYDKAVYCQKPLAHYVSEVRAMKELAAQKNLVTQMGIQVHSFYDYKLATFLIQGAVIGKVSKVIAWSNKNWGYDGAAPSGEDP
ncbi:MAG: Gfo/Idh/MocA family oxidoreductase, partial [Saprospiraceae bacterium]|nr:Gfo/Idh/MocA family oxidoreductase [Saprospiraceae bacterium]